MREKAVKEALKEKEEQEQVKQEKQIAMERADAERKKNKHLHATLHKAHDHMMVVVGPVNDKQPYWQAAVAASDGNMNRKGKNWMKRDRYKEAKKWIETAKQTEKAVEGQWKLKEEDVQRRENRREAKI